MNLSQRKLLEIAENAISELEFSEYSHEELLEYLDITEEEFQEIKNASFNRFYVYMVLFDYSTDDCSGIDTYIFDTYEKAVEKFEQIIENEKKPENSWVAHAYENGKLSSAYELDTNIDDIQDDEEHELWWNITCKHDWYLHSFLDLRIKEVK